VTSTARYDAIVVGVGSIGSAALFHLARRGKSVLGLEQFGVAHDRGSMHGETRIIRLAYHEHPAYVPLLWRAYELWRELDETLLHVVGSLDVGPANGDVIAGALLACREHGLPYELVDGAQLLVPDGHVALFQPDGGYLESERSVRAHVDAALAAGATLETGERVLDWSSSDGVTRVRTQRGSYEADRLVLCPGAWASGLLRLPADLFAVERQVVAWFEASELEGFPVLVVEEDDDANYYGIAAGGRLKVGRMSHPGGAVDPDSFDREVGNDEVEVLRSFVERRLPGVGRVLDTQTCMFTNTPDRNFVLDLHPEAEHVVVASICSGHGFKFASVAGELIADLALEETTRPDADFLRLERFRGAPTAARLSDAGP
jgi:sarcosine oxidase